MIPDDPSQPQFVEPSVPAALDPEAPARVGLAARIEAVQTVLMMAASQADTLLSRVQQIQGAYRDMAERLRLAPRPEAVLNLHAWLDSLRNELDWLITKHPLSDNQIDIATMHARLAMDEVMLLNLRSEAEQALRIAGQIASARDEVGSLTSQLAAVSYTKQRSEALLATAKSLFG